MLWRSIRVTAWSESGSLYVLGFRDSSRATSRGDISLEHEVLGAEGCVVTHLRDARLI